MPTDYDASYLAEFLADMREAQARLAEAVAYMRETQAGLDRASAEALAYMRKLKPRVDAWTSVIEGLQIIERDPRMRADPEMHAVMTVILSQGNPEDWPVSAATPENMVKLLGGMALALQKETLSAINSKSASGLRKPKKREAAFVTFQAWGGAAMTAEKRDECERYVAHELNSDRRTVTGWFKDFIDHPDSY